MQSFVYYYYEQPVIPPTPPTPPVVQQPPTENSWLVQPTPNLEITIPINRLTDTDSFFDFDIGPDSPASPAEECEYIKLDESESKAIPNDIAPESGYVCSSPSISSGTSSGESHVSSDGPFFDPESSEADQRSLSLSVDYYDCVDSKSKDQLEFQNGYAYPVLDSDSCSESLPQSQSTTTSLSTFTAFSSASNNTLQDEAMPDVVMPREQSDTWEHSTMDINNVIKDVRTETSKFDYMKPMTLDFPKLVPSSPEASPEPDERISEPDTNQTIETTEHLTVLIEDDDTKPQRVRRCSSLKTGKTPPGTPGRKKIVRFADVLGLDLADVKTFLDEIPTVPRSAYADLHISLFDDPVMLGPTSDRILMPVCKI